MRAVRVGLSAVGVMAIVALAIWLGAEPGVEREQDLNGPLASHREMAPLRIGLIPERDIFEQRARYRALADYLAEKLARRVELVTAPTYETMLHDLEHRQVDGAFVGSLVTVLAVDRHGAQVAVKPQLEAGDGTYRGILFVREDSPITSIDHLGGRRIAMVRTTTGGNLFAMCQLRARGLLTAADRATPLWVGTHDEVMHLVLSGEADAGASKSHRVEAYERAHPQVRLRRLAMSEAVPENALVLREGLGEATAAALMELLLAMDEDERGRAILQTFGAQRFVPCGIEDYGAVYDMIEQVAGDWEQLGIAGPPPQRGR